MKKSQGDIQLEGAGGQRRRALIQSYEPREAALLDNCKPSPNQETLITPTLWNRLNLHRPTNSEKQPGHLVSEDARTSSRDHGNTSTEQTRSTVRPLHDTPPSPVPTPPLLSSAGVDGIFI